MSEEKLVGLEVESKSLDLVDGDLVGKASVKHQGKIGYLKISVEGGISALEFVNKGIDFLEEKIPGDQKIYAALIKEQIAKIKFKF